MAFRFRGSVGAGQALRVGLLLTGIAIAGELASAIGWCLGNKARWTALLAGAFGNAVPGLLLTTLLYATLARRPRALLAALVVSFVLQSVFTIGCAGFALERGTPVALFDIQNGLDAGFVVSQFPVLFGANFGPYLALATALFVGSSFGLLRGLWSPAAASRLPRMARWPVLLVVAVVAAICWSVHRLPRGEFASRPYARLLGAVMTTNHHNVVVGVEPVLLEKTPADADAESGLALLGIQAKRCPDGLHVGEPLSKELPAQPELEASWAALATKLGELGRPFSYTFIMLESVGAEDIHALDPGAPQGLTPYLDELAKGAGQQLVMRRLFQAGQRTAFAVSALLCGVGTAPALLAPLRDLPHLRLRCWPDIAAEAGVSQRFFYGEDLEFDRYRDTLKEHGFSYLHVPRLAGRKRGGWGLSDRELFVDVLADLKAAEPPASGPAAVVRGMLTLSTHSPYGVPEDMPDAARARALALAKRVTDNSDAQAHWVTVSYLDDALSRFVPELMAAETERGRTPVVMLVGDHTSGQTLGRHPLASSRIPAFWLFPPSIERALLEPVQRALDGRAWSQNDLARMALALLDGAGALRSLPEARRWHSMGGQALSPAFSAPAPFQQARLWTIDVRAKSFLLGESERVLLQESIEPPSTREDLEQMGFAGAALPSLSWLLTHASRLGPCPSGAP